MRGVTGIASNDLEQICALKINLLLKIEWKVELFCA